MKVNESTMNATLIGSVIVKERGCTNGLYEPSMMMNQ